MYEMFRTRSVEQSKPWDTNGIDGVYRFLKKFWTLFYSRDGEFIVNQEAATKEELKSLHKLIRKWHRIWQFSYNTSVSAFMICINELYTLKCNKKRCFLPYSLFWPLRTHTFAKNYGKAVGNKVLFCDAQWLHGTKITWKKTSLITPFLSMVKHVSIWNLLLTLPVNPFRKLCWPMNALWSGRKEKRLKGDCCSEENS